MNTLLTKPSETGIIPLEFKDIFALFDSDSSLPYAMRAPLDSAFPNRDTAGDDIVFEQEHITVSKNNELIICSFGSCCRHKAVIKLNDARDAKLTVNHIKAYLLTAEKALLCLDSPRTGYQPIFDLIDKTAKYCGCLTDINLPENDEIFKYRDISGTKIKDHSCIVALNAICLMFRRLSALRGFNFKMIFEKEAVWFAFSAKIPAEEICDVKDIPECAALEDLDSNGGITVYHKLLKPANSEIDGLGRLTVLFSIQTNDPKGILKAPEWRLRAKQSIDKLDLDIPGRF